MSNSQVNFILILLLGFVWGASFMLNKVIVQDISPALMTTIRLFLAAIFLSFFIKKTDIKSIKENIFILFVIGILNFSIPFYLYARAAVDLDASLTAVLNGITPIFVLLIGILFFRNKINLKQVIGIAIGFVGLVMFTGYDSLTISIYPVVLCLIGSICYAICTNILEKLKQISTIVLTTIPLIFGAFGSIPMTLMEMNTNFYLNPTTTSIVSLLVLSFICTSLGLLGWIYIMKRSSALIASTVIYLIPITAMIWSSLLLSEIITFLMVIGLSLMLFGVWMTNYFDIKKNPGNIL